jgi:MGT family glycosyltransferase
MGQTLIAHGHDVSWIGHPEVLNRSLPEGFIIHSLGEQLEHEELGVLHEGRDRRGLAAFKFLWEGVLIPLAQQSFHQVCTHLEDIQPDICVVDQQTLAGALACRSLNLPWVTTATTSAALIDALAPLPLVKTWLDDRLLQLQNHLQQPPLPEGEMIDLSPHGVIVFSSRKLSESLDLPAPYVSDLSLAQRLSSSEPPPKRSLFFPSHFKFVGPALHGQRAQISFPWDRLRADHTKIFFSLGTVNAHLGERLYHKLVEALGSLEGLQVIAAAPPALFPALPDHFIVRERVPQLEVLKVVDLVICHGGHNTTCEALAHGIPLLILPIKDDQSIIAEQVKAVGAGLRAHFNRIKVPKLRALTLKLLSDDSYRRSAQLIKQEFTREDGSLGAARVVEELIDK